MFWMGFNCLKATEPLWRASLLFTNKLLKLLVLIWSASEGWKAESTLESWNHPMVFNLGALNFESMALTARPFLHLLNHQVVTEFGCGPCYLCFCLNRVQKERFLKVFTFFQTAALYLKIKILIQFPDIYRSKSIKKSEVGEI